MYSLMTGLLYLKFCSVCSLQQELDDHDWYILMSCASGCLAFVLYLFMFMSKLRSDLEFMYKISCFSSVIDRHYNIESKLSTQFIR